MELSFFGAAGEVGRSCIMVDTGKTRVLLDSGVKLGKTVEYPVIDDSELRSIDAILLSHAHLDHSGYLPHIYTAGYQGEVYTTKPTVELTKVLLSDYMRISRPDNVTREGMSTLDRHFKMMDFKREFSVGDLRVKFIPAGHILGSAMISISDGSRRLLYTGDVNVKRTKLLEGADLKGMDGDVLITESTYGGADDVFKSEKETAQAMLKSMNDTVSNGGKVIVPSFAVGRAQEVLMLLDDYINSGVMQKVPVYVDGMINKAMRIYRHNVIYCRKELQMKILMSDYDPFKSPNFVPVTAMGTRKKIAGTDESVIVITTSGMLTGGPVMWYLKKMAGNPLNKMILVGYQASGTLGRALQDGTKSIGVEGKRVDVEMGVETFHLSAHADRRQLEELAGRVKGLRKVFIVHGEREKGAALRETLAGKYDAVTPNLGESLVA